MPQQVVKGSFSDVAGQVRAQLEANNARFKADATALKSHLEASNAKFKADLEALAPRKQKKKAAAEPASSGVWILARKCWSWMRRD